MAVLQTEKTQECTLKVESSTQKSCRDERKLPEGRCVLPVKAATRLQRRVHRQMSPCCVQLGLSIDGDGTRHPQIEAVSNAVCRGADRLRHTQPFRHRQVGV